MSNSVTDLINLANFDLAQRQQTPQAMGNFVQKISQMINTQLEEHRQRETQKKLSDLLKKDEGNLEPTYTVDKAGKVSAKYKTKKKAGDFINVLKEATERIKGGEDFSVVALELETNYPKRYTTTVEKHLKKIGGVKEERKLTSSQRISKSNALSVLEKGGVGGELFESKQEAEAYIIDEFKVDIKDPEIQEALEKYKPTEEKFTKGWFQKYPRKQKYGYTYEKREDGQWHLID